MLTVNAKVKNCGLRKSYKEPDIMEAWFDLELEGGGGVLFTISTNFRSEENDGFCLRISEVFEILETDSLENAVGKPLRAIFEAPNNELTWGEKLIGIQNFIGEEKIMI